MREQHGFSFTPTRQPVQHLTTRDYYHQYPTQRQHRQATHATHDPRYSQQRQNQPKQTYTTTRKPDIDEEIIEDALDTRPPRSAIRYRPVDYDVDIEGVQVAHHYHDQPLIQRRSRKPEPPPTRQRYEEEEYGEEPPVRKRVKVRLHFLVFIGVGLLLMLAGYIGLNILGSWWQTHQDDVTYGNPRTYQVDAVVGHGDSKEHPTHFIALNLKGQVIVIELPGGNTAKAISYTVTTIPDNSSNPPVKLLFQDLNGDGKPDMVIEIGDPGSIVTINLYNNGAQFVSKLGSG